MGVVYLSAHGIVLDRGQGQAIAGGLYELRHFSLTVTDVRTLVD